MIDDAKLTHGSLFSGIGGFEGGAELSGIKTIWSCEYEKFQRSILKKQFPETIQYDDIRTMQNPRYVDIVSGGFPCQDISVAGKGKGINGERSGLWGEMFRICRIVRPRYVIIENSPALLYKGFEQVLCDLSSIGYNAEWQVLSNLSFGYPHLRERVYVIAYSNEIRLQSDVCEGRSFDSIFKQRSSNQSDGYSCAKRILEIRAHSNIRNDDGFRNWSHRVGSVGNSVNRAVAHYLFECIRHAEAHTNIS
jgi:DNA (cytosine-5)-methyltransferase 1